MYNHHTGAEGVYLLAFELLIYRIHTSIQPTRAVNLALFVHAENPEQTIACFARNHFHGVQTETSTTEQRLSALRISGSTITSIQHLRVRKWRSLCRCFFGGGIRRTYISPGLLANIDRNLQAIQIRPISTAYYYW